MLSPRRKAALVALIVFAVLAALAIHASPLSAGSLEARLQTEADAALYRIRADEWAEVRMDGQVAILSGRAPSPEARDQAVAVLRRAEWAGGVVAGGITRVVDETRLANADRRFGLRADLAAGRLTLTGFAPDADAVRRIEDQAADLFDGRVDADIRLAPGAAPVGWEEAVRLMLRELARLDAGAALVEGERVVITGLAADAERASAVRTAFSRTPPGVFSAAALVRTEGQGFKNRIAEPDLCELLVRAAFGNRPIGFSPGLDMLSPSVRPALRRAGEAFAACDAGPLEVRVRAEDEAGDPLARDRAEAIVSVMTEAGRPESDFVIETAPPDSDRAVRFSIVPFEPVRTRPEAGEQSEAADGTEADGETLPDQPTPEEG